MSKISHSQDSGILFSLIHDMIIFAVYFAAVATMNITTPPPKFLTPKRYFPRIITAYDIEIAKIVSMLPRYDSNVGRAPLAYATSEIADAYRGEMTKQQSAYITANAIEVIKYSFFFKLISSGVGLILFLRR